MVGPPAFESTSATKHSPSTASIADRVWQRSSWQTCSASLRHVLACAEHTAVLPLLADRCTPLLRCHRWSFHLRLCSWSQMLLQRTQCSAMPLEHALVVAARPRLDCRCWQLPLPLQFPKSTMLLQHLAPADCRSRMATPLESLHRLHSGRVQHSVIAAAAPLEECANGGITAQPTSIRLGWRKAWQRRWP
jgi:hypothetical protein